MLTTVETTVLPGGRIEISSPTLIPGQKAKVLVMIEGDQSPKRSAIDILAEAKGHRLFKTAQEVEAYLREERDSWEH
jgi:hypothetical protein